MSNTSLSLSPPRSRSSSSNSSHLPASDQVLSPLSEANTSHHGLNSTNSQFNNIFKTSSTEDMSENGDGAYNARFHHNADTKKRRHFFQHANDGQDLESLNSDNGIRDEQHSSESSPSIFTGEIVTPIKTSKWNPIRRLFRFIQSLLLDPIQTFFLKTDHVNGRKVLCWKCVSPRVLCGILFVYFALTCTLALAWFTGWIVLEDDAQSAPDSSTIFPKSLLLPPHGPIFALAILVYIAYLVGWTTHVLTSMPALLGMLITGFLMRNIPYVSLLPQAIPPQFASTLRSFALCTILLKAGLGLNLGALLRLGHTTLLLATLPNLMECLAIAIPSAYILRIPFVWSFMLGCTLVSVSPAVVVPNMVSLQERQLGTRKGIPSMVLGAASLDDVLAISGFSIFLGLAFDSGTSLVLLIFHAPIEICCGIFGGILLGILMWPLTLLDHKTDKLRALAIFVVSLCTVYGTSKIGYSGSGTMAVMVMGTVVGKLWNKEQLLYMNRVTGSVWIVAQPLLFSLIGSAIDVSTLKWSVVGYGVGIIATGLVFRMISVFVVSLCCCSSLNLKESLYMLVVFLPKATVQAALGPIPLGMALQQDYGDGSLQIEWAENILTLAVLTILLTAPLGAALIGILGPILLEKDHRGGECVDVGREGLEMKSVEQMENSMALKETPVHHEDLQDTDEHDSADGSMSCTSSNM
uniref:Cation/H+ exchanger transmembrane domain-containing protein n=1 Tax=Percolomonas cosmopolitus TaxID=63605 RepID=A0A7S1KR58_9EUKA